MDNGCFRESDRLGCNCVFHYCLSHTQGESARHLYYTSEHTLIIHNHIAKTIQSMHALPECIYTCIYIYI